MSKAANWDYFIMLTSAEWATPYSPLLGFSASKNVADVIQTASRSVVKDFLNGASDYYHVDFSDTRYKKTHAFFNRRMQDLCLPETQIEMVLNAANEFTHKSSDGAIDWLLGRAANQIFKSDQLINNQLAESIFNQCMQYWEQSSDFYSYSSEIERACLLSKDDWDIFLRSLTPGQPTVLSDMLIELADNKGVRLFWSLIKTRLTKEQISGFRLFWMNNAITLGGHDHSLEFPAWLVNN
jgi:hypothetical protein